MTDLAAAVPAERDGDVLLQCREGRGGDAPPRRAGRGSQGRSAVPSREGWGTHRQGGVEGRWSREAPAAANDAACRRSVIDHHALKFLLNLLTTHYKETIIKKEACRIISIITAHNREQIQAVVNANIITPLVHLMHTAESEIKHEAARAISNVTSGGTRDQIKYLVAHGCIKPLCDLLICLDSDVVLVCLNGIENILKVGEAEKNHRAGGINAYAQMVDDAKGLDKIENLWSHKNNWICEMAGKMLESYWLELKLLPQMVQSVFSDDPNMHLDATVQLRKLLSIERNHHRIIMEVVSRGAVPRFIEFLTRDDNHQLQAEASRALRIIASGTSERTKLVAQSGAVPIFVKLLNSQSEAALWVLASVAFVSPEYRDLVLDHGGLSALLLQLNKHTTVSMLRVATWTLSTFCNGRPQPTLDQVKLALSALQHVIHSDDVVVLVNACRTLACLSSENNDRMQAVVKSGVLPRLVELLIHGARIHDTLLSKAALHGPSEGRDLTCNRKGRLCHEKSIKIGACFAISKIAAGNNEQIQAVINANIIPRLVHLLPIAEFDIRKFAARAISNATSGGTHDQIKYLVAQGCIKPLCDMLVCPNPSTVTFCLEGLENILRVGEGGDHNAYAQIIDGSEGWDKIEKLRSHDNTDICVKAVKILQSYWLEEKDGAMPSGDSAQDGNSSTV
ncbi:hypothetical protein U9M48_043282 [Paspalum notatum var. saurae]|uniref:Importin subunit alpha n=1 Tax=Paspalum notatum var. saurae TaxID=547442 RepID=A0AAQ3USG7_PASNO